MRKILKKWGTTGIGIYLSMEERKIYNLELDDVVEIEIKKIDKK